MFHLFLFLSPFGLSLLPSKPAGEDAEGLRIKTLSELEAEDFESLLESSEGDAQD